MRKFRAGNRIRIVSPSHGFPQGLMGTVLEDDWPGGLIDNNGNDYAYWIQWDDEHSPALHTRKRIDECCDLHDPIQILIDEVT